MKTTTSTWQLFKLLRHHRRLADKRSMMSASNRAAKVILGVMSLVVVVYLMGGAVMLALIANDSQRFTSPEFLCLCAPFIFAVDFLLRFTMQQTPAQMVKPYILLPLPRRMCVGQFVATSVLSWGNTVWLVMVVPYCLMSVVFSHGLWTALLLTLYFWLLAMTNSQWYAIVRTLINDSMLWWLLPVAVYALMFVPLALLGGTALSSFMRAFTLPGSQITVGNPLPLLIAGLVLAAIIRCNASIQFIHVMSEVQGNGKTKEIRSARKFAFLNRYGDMGQYIKLELRMMTRNKNPRKLFTFATAIVVLLTVIICSSDIYDSETMTTFWCVYNFIVYGAMMLTRIMSYEGNYIDCLMVRKENILSLLKAKYAVYCMLLAIPFVLMLPLVVVGKWSLLMLVSMALFTAGFQYFVLFQLAVYNKQTVPLNSKFTSKTGMENNYAQLLAQAVTFALPMFVISITSAMFSENVAYTVIMCIGIVFVATSRLWMHNIYKRMMKRRYDNMASFRATR